MSATALTMNARRFDEVCMDAFILRAVQGGKENVGVPIPFSNLVRKARLLNGHPTDIDLRQNRRAESRLFGHQQMVVAKTKRLLAADRAWIIVTHHGGADGISGDAVESGDQHAGRSER